MNFKELKEGSRVIAICNGNTYSKGDKGTVYKAGMIECDYYISVKLDEGNYTGLVLADSFNFIKE